MSTLIIIPPFDLFTVSKNNQYDRVFNVLNENNMIQNNSITKNSNLDTDAKREISTSIEYLYRMGYTSEISWLPSNFSYYSDFEKIFGFNTYEIDFPNKTNNFSLDLLLESGVPIPINEYDYLIEFEIKEGLNDLLEFNNINDTGISIEYDYKTDSLIVSENKTQLIDISFSSIRSNIIDIAKDNKTLSLDNSSFIFENENVKMNLIVKNAYYVNESFSYLPFIKFYLLISIH